MPYYLSFCEDEGLDLNERRVQYIILIKVKAASWEG
jgi:hypothetical protein